MVAHYAEHFAVYSDYAAIAMTFVHILLLYRHLVLFSRCRATVHLLLVLFSCCRVTIFGLRALQTSISPCHEFSTIRRHNAVINNAGTSAILYAAYLLVLQRDEFSGPHVTDGLRGIVRRLRRNRGVVLASLLYCIFLRLKQARSVVYSYWLMHRLDRNHKPVRKADAPLYLIVCCILVFQMFVLLRHEGTRYIDERTDHRPHRRSTSLIFIAIIVAMLFLRSLFSALAVGSDGPAPTNTATGETFYYIFSAVPESLAAALLGVPGVVPSPIELRLHSWSSRQLPI